MLRELISHLDLLQGVLQLGHGSIVLVALPEDLGAPNAPVELAVLVPDGLRYLGEGFHLGLVRLRAQGEGSVALDAPREEPILSDLDSKDFQDSVKLVALPPGGDEKDPLEELSLDEPEGARENDPALPLGQFYHHSLVILPSLRQFRVHAAAAELLGQPSEHLSVRDIASSAARIPKQYPFRSLHKNRTILKMHSQKHSFTHRP